MKNFVSKINPMYVLLVVLGILFVGSLMRFFDEPEVVFVKGQPTDIISPVGITHIKPGDPLPSWYKRVNVQAKE